MGEKILVGVAWPYINGEKHIGQIAGAYLPPKVNGTPRDTWTSFKVKKGQVLSFDFLKKGARAYIAVAGGIDVPVVLGSRSTYALGALGIPALDSFIANAINYLPNVIAAILIVVAAIALAGLVGAAVKRFMGDTVLGRIVGTTAPAFILVVAGFMALVQLRIAVPIVTSGRADVLALPPAWQQGRFVGLVLLAALGYALYRTATARAIR